MAVDRQQDLYAVLQVHPDADQEVIEAAYRQLMKKHHPDLAGTDPRRVAEYHERAKLINQAFSVLRDPWRRREYDFQRQVRGPARAQYAAEPPPPPRTPPPPTQTWSSSAVDATIIEPHPAGADVTFAVPSSSPFGLLGQAYYLLPGTYEWERGHGRELLTTLMLPVLGVSGFSLATGRLAPWIGHGLNATILAWAVLAIVSIPLWQSLPRIALATVPSVAVLSGTLNPFLSQAHVPVWMAAALLSLLSLALAARIYVFGVLPSIAACWLIAHFT
jgi:hypothetical protein